MKKTLMWSAVTAAVGAGALFGYRWWQRARTSVATGLEQAERVTAATRQTLEETERALRQTRSALQ